MAARETAKQMLDIKGAMLDVNKKIKQCKELKNKESEDYWQEVFNELVKMKNI